MSKTDKELTVEVVNNFISSWDSAERTNAIDSPQLINLIQSVHKAISSLPEKQDK